MQLSFLMLLSRGSPKLGSAVPTRLLERFQKLPKWQRELIREDMETAFENRIVVMERVNCGL